MSAEANFRRGILQGAQWFREEVERRAADGWSAEEISDRLFDLMEALNDWANGTTETPQGAPWEWAEGDLDDFIRERLDGLRPEFPMKRSEWTGARPLEPGFFWYRAERGQTAEKVEVFRMWGKLYVVPPGHAEPLPLYAVDGEWSGPISPPE